MTEATSIKTEVDKFHRFVTERLDNGVASMTLEESLAEFRAYQEEVASLHAVLRESAAEARRGECGPLDIEEFIREQHELLAREKAAD